ncbi:Clostripain family [Seminavis robusta]|uniref:Clostripain family n=1 Tax=Seminavis robusta TaxID=568900 RepID=A0A9N8EV43_9STRA|nr:Clostripain family [Seminavis robusta]|eukprot:Sro1915_g305090.1 Clostripain family (1052) ;mRNA; f:631-3885
MIKTVSTIRYTTSSSPISTWVSLFLALVVSLSFLFSGANAWPTGAGDCPAGIVAVGDPHLTGDVTSGTLEESPQTLRVLLNNAVLGDKPAAVLAGRAFSLELVGNTGTFKGFLIRLGSNGDNENDLSTSLYPETDDDDSNVQTAQDVCGDQAGGITHTSSVEKESIQAFLQVPPTMAGELTLDVTVVIGLAGSGGDSEYYFSTYSITAVAGAPIPSPAPTPASKKTCLMVYQMADNEEMHPYLVHNYQALAKSPLVRATDQVRTWIYHDAYNNAGGQILPDTFDVNGTELVTDPFNASRYSTFDPRLGSMRMDVEFQNEQNSDDTNTIRDFLVHALENCLANGYDQLVAIFAGSAGGFAGFGGDANTRRLQQLQTNPQLAQAIRRALDSVSRELFLNVRLNLQVLGFDSNSMQGLGVADAYPEVTDYILASESIMPGHGWAYENLQPHDNALDLARDILGAFLNHDEQSVPKTMALFDTQLFDTFVTAWENLFLDLGAALENLDSNLRAHVSRARALSVAFLGVMDSLDVAANPSSLDIGSFLSTFRTMCNPQESLDILLQEALDAYSDMFVEQGVGLGTAPGTGMHVTWPSEGDYNADTQLWRQVLFQDGNYVNYRAPIFVSFLQELFAPPAGDLSSSNNSTESVCFNSVEPPMTGNGSSLVLDDSITIDNATGHVELQATVAVDVAEVIVEFGVDVSSATRLVLQEAGLESSPTDYMIAMGGNVPGSFENAIYKAAWDKSFYYISVGDEPVKPIYVHKEGGGSRVPVMHFPEETSDAVASIELDKWLLFDLDYWLSQGGRFGNLILSLDDVTGTIDDIALYTSNPAGSATWAQVPKEAGGLIVPLLYVDGKLQGSRINVLPGGLDQTVLSWGPDLDYKISQQNATEVFDSNPHFNGVVLNLNAYSSGDSTGSPESISYGIMSREIDEALEVEATEMPTMLGSVSTTGLYGTTPPLDEDVTSAPMTATAIPTELPLEDSTVVPFTSTLDPSDSPLDDSTSVPLTSTEYPSITPTGTMESPSLSPAGDTIVGRGGNPDTPGDQGEDEDEVR